MNQLRSESFGTVMITHNTVQGREEDLAESSGDKSAGC
jgi:hypothetical protein